MRLQPSRKTSHRLIRGVVAIVAAVAILAGCSDDSSSGGGGTRDIFVAAVGTNPASLNAAITTDNSTGFIGQAMFETLVNLGKGFVLKPGLAKSWSSNADATEFTFILQDGVKWHDGQDFTSADVKFNFEHVIALHPLGGPIAKQLAAVETPDPHTVIVKLKEPFGPLVEAMTTFVTLPAHIYEGSNILTNPANLKPVGTGPYKFDKFNSGDSVELSRFEGYWGGKPNIKRLIFKILPDNNSRTLALQSGDIDYIPETFFELAQRSVLQADKRFLVYDAPSPPQQMLMFFNTKNGPLTNYTVRKALYQAVDRQAIASKVYLDTAKPALGPIPNQVEWARDPSIDFTKQFPYDPAAAGKLLDDAGYPKKENGRRFTLNLHYINGFPAHAGASQQVKANLEAIGVGVDLIGDDSNVYTQSVYAKSNFDLTVLELAAYADPSLGVARAYVCNPNRTNFTNASQLCDPAMDAEWNAARANSDRTIRRQYFTKAQQMVAQTLGAAPFTSAITTGVVRADRWTGLEQFISQQRRVWSAPKAR